VVLPGAVVASTSRLGARYGPVVALRDVSLDVRAGEVLAVMGRNGAGKSTLLAHLAGLREPTDGKVTIDGQVPHRLKAKDLVRRVALVPADPGLLLYAETIDAECRGADRDSELEPGTTRAAVERIVPGLDPAAHPRDVSEGQRLGVALGVVLAPAPPLVLLDEPTRGLDYVAKARLVEILRELSASGHAVVMATHDVELVAEVARRVVVLADGELVADGPAREVVCHSPIFAPQVAKVLAPDEWLTVAEVEAALAS
jgi:energy-coupling factor transport system ATP-binding protein